MCIVHTIEVLFPFYNLYFIFFTILNFLNIMFLELLIPTQCILRAVHKLCRLGRGEGGGSKDDLLHRPYFKKTKQVEGVKNRRFSDDIVYGLYEI